MNLFFSALGIILNIARIGVVILSIIRQNFYFTQPTRWGQLKQEMKKRTESNEIKNLAIWGAVLTGLGSFFQLIGLFSS